MRKGKKIFILLIVLTFLIEGSVSLFFLQRSREIDQDTVAVNDVLKTIEENFGQTEKYPNDMSYSGIDNDGKLLFATEDGISTSVNEAVRNNDTILDLTVDGSAAGKVLFHNATRERIGKWQQAIAVTVLCSSIIQAVLVISYMLYLRKTIVKPFDELSDFANRVAGGDLDIPLEMDKGNTFGSFTEAFDLMRTELKKSRAAEKAAYDAKKDMVAQLSHDIKTPVASIKSASEFGYELAKDEKVKERFNLINFKADELTVLVDNLFVESVKDASEIKVSPRENDSSTVREAILHADFQSRAGEFTIPECTVFTDKLRLQQAFDNVFINSYKYADTEIKVEAKIEGEYLKVAVRDFGPGVTDEEVAVLKEKYKRGANSEGKDGAGIGLYLTNYFIKEMDGDILITNENPGLQVLFLIRTK
ncbi:MAG: HAMP domain-containing histidine kinase [Clostridiales bacterium]|nr:HAMP domain-containing histidine kinase [Clostridiales bacterium]